MGEQNSGLAGRALEEAMEAFPTGVLIVDDAGTIRFANRELEVRLGYPRVELIGQSVDMLVPRDVRDEHSAQRTAFFAQPSSRPMGGGRELFARRKDGELLPVEIGLNPVQTEAGVLIVASVVDVTERQKAERSLRAAEERLQQSQKLEVIGTFASGIAHDFNNILGAILGYAELARLQTGPETNIRSDLDAILSAAERGRHLVQRILSFGRRKEAKPVEVCLTHVVGEALELLKASLPGLIVVVRGDFDPQTPAILGDETQLHQVVMNLITNAAQAMPTGGTVTVSVSPAVVSELEARKKGLTAGPHARLRIVDTGVGMTPEVLQRAFEPFFTTKPVGNGTGLGLSVIRSILDRMEGAIDLTSTPGQGTTATVLLPTVRSLEPTGGRPAAGQSVPSRKHILYVEDEHALADLARRQLQALGYRVTVFTSSTEALEEFRTDPGTFDAMVTDSNMPRLSGTSLTQIVKSIRPSLPIVMISGMGNSPERTPIPTVDRLIPKPFRLAALDQALKELL